MVSDMLGCLDGVLSLNFPLCNKSYLCTQDRASQKDERFLAFTDGFMSLGRSAGFLAWAETCMPLPCHCQSAFPLA